jgi:predicted ATPase/signal transduction histidine kinase
MLSLSCYKITETLYAGDKTIVYRGYRERDQCPLIFKTLAAEYPPRKDLARLQHEFALIKDWAEPGLIHAHDLVQHQNSLVLILEDIGGRAIRQLMNGKAMPVGEFLPLAIAFARSLNQIHQHQIIHKAISPDNLVLNPATGLTQIIDFGLASQLSRETTSLQNPGHLEGTLAYLSPEQTGRMNRVIDYRSDFYSLGATFYEMLTGVPPFSATDPMELVHCHLAKTPPPIHEHRSGLPPVLNQLVQKMMAKTAEQRYQSAFGLIADLQTCHQQWLTTQQEAIPQSTAIASFALGQHDVSEHFQIPQKLYGREREVQQLLDAFDRVSLGASEMLLVAGYSGAGKTALVQEVHRSLTEKSGYFIAGKFDQFQRDIPYASLIASLQELVRQLLTESTARIARWKVLLTEALGGNAQVIIEVIPEVEWLIGPQAAVPDLPPTQAQNRFNFVLQQFVHVFTQAQHPLVLFLDDLQWADLPSLQLIELFMTAPDTRYLLLIGAYRDNEVSATHPLMLTLEKIGKAATAISATITLKPLAGEHVRQLLAESLHCTPEQSQSLAALAELCLQKTQGNPFFLSQFLYALVEAGQIKFNNATGCWQWDMQQLQQTPITDNVVELMAKKIRTLPEKTQALIELAACIGNQFTLNTLALVAEQSGTATAQALWPALQVNLIVPLNEEYRYITHEFAPKTDFTFQFVHDRVQQAAYSLIALASKIAFHLRIGRLLLAHLTPEQREERIFDVVYHWNRGRDLLTTQAEKVELAQLNLYAGRKAKSSVAYKPALSYFETGLILLDANGWETHYELTLALAVEAAEAAWLSGDFERVDELIKLALQKAVTFLDQVAVYQVQIHACIARNQAQDAIRIAFMVLKRLGVELPDKPTYRHVQRGLREIRTLLRGRSIDDLVKLPAMTEAGPVAAIQILSSVAAVSFIVAPELFPIIFFEQIHLSLKYGHTAQSAHAYSGYGAILCANGDIEAGYRFGNLAVTLVDHLCANAFEAKVSIFMEDHIRHWKESFHGGAIALLDAWQCAVQTGDFEYAAYIAFDYCYFLYFTGSELSEVQTEQAKYAQAIAHFKQEAVLHWQKIVQQTILNLSGRNDDPCCLKGAVYDEETTIIAPEDGTVILTFHFNKLILCYLFGKYTEGLAQSLAAEKHIADAVAHFTIPLCHFYMALVRLALVPQAPENEQNRLLEEVALIQKKLKKWAGHAPMNYLNKWHLVEAERSRVTGKEMAAMSHYNQAITLAGKNGFPQEEALAHELAARFYLAKDQEKIARNYLREAHAGYQRWGAGAKVKQLETQYPALLMYALGPDASSTGMARADFAATHGNIMLNSETLDLTTVMKATQAISSEIVLGQLLEKLMHIAIENAGAQHGFLLLESDGEWRIEAEGDVNGDRVRVLQSQPLIPPCNAGDAKTDAPDLPVSIIQYVARSKQGLVLEDAIGKSQFAQDPYILRSQPRSVLCTPILHQGKLAAILYLENRLVPGAFTADRLSVLKILSAQAAISIEHARIYDNLETTVAQRTAALSDSNAALFQAGIVAENARQKAESARQEAEAAEQKATRALADLRITQTNLIQSEKMASLGTLTAGVAHEINNPTNFTHVAAQIQRADLIEFERFLMGLLEESPDPAIVAEFSRRFVVLQNNVDTMLNGTERIITIVKNLRSFSGLDEAERKTVLLSEGMNATLQLVRTAWLEKVEFITEFAADPPFECSPKLLNQVFMNLLLNACQAVEAQQKKTGKQDKGRVWLRLRQASGEFQGELQGDIQDGIVAEIEDEGIGIESDVLPHILEPFFTTRCVGSGTGLGLTTSFGIIQQHHGRLSITSTPGQGSCFTIFLPQISQESR